MKKVVNHALAAKKKIVFIMMALVCAKMLNAKVIVAAAADEPAAAYDTLMVAGDTLLYPQHPKPIDLDLSNPRKAPLAAACPTDSIVGLDVNENYVSKVEYEYDEAGRTISQADYKWENGVKTGKKVWYKYTGNTATTTVNMTWDNEKGWLNEDSTELLYAGTKNIKKEVFKWENNKRRADKVYEYAYDAKGRQILSQYSTWDASGDSLKYNNKREYAYDENDNLVLNAYYSSYKKGWIGSSKTVWKYKAPKYQILKEVYSGWENNDWKGSSKDTTYYNENNKDTATISYKWSSGWVLEKRVIKVYNSSNQVIENATYFWRNNNGYHWQGSSRTTTETEGIINREIKYSWNKTDRKWVNSTKKETSSDSESSMEATFDWNVEKDKWIGKSKFENTLSGGKVILHTEYIWGADDWAYSTKEETTYVPSTSTVESKLKYKWVSGAWMGLSYTKSVFDGKKLAAYLTYAWDGSDWRDSARISYTYDAKGDTLLKVNAEWKESAWQPIDSAKHEVVYKVIAGQEKKTLDCQMKWTSSDNLWVGSSKTEWQYDEGANMIQSDSYTFANGDWVNNERRQYAYKDNNASLRTLSLSMKYQNGKWVGQFKYEYGFDESNTQVMTAQYSWDSNNDTWIGTSKTQHVSSAEGKTTYTYTWNSQLNTWVDLSKQEYVNDAKGRTLSQTNSKYDIISVDVETHTVSGKWTYQTRYRYEYDTKHTEAVLTIVEQWIDDEWCNQSKTEQKYDEDAQGKLRYQLDASYSNCQLTKYDFKRYYYRCDPKYYSITFYNWDDTVLFEALAEEGTLAAYPTGEELPTKADDIENSYTFAGWEPALATVTGDASYKATFTATKKSYTIAFVNYDDTPLQSSSVEFGTMPAYAGETPVKANTAQYTYTFKGWKPAITEVEGDAVYKADYDSTVNVYTITFKNWNDTVLAQQTVAYGTTPVYDGTPEKTGDAQYSYTFNGWDSEPVAVVADATYKAQFTQSVNEYTITFNNYDDTPLQSSQVAYGETPSFTQETPTKAGDAQYSYTFSGWTPGIVAVTGAATYTAQYTPSLNTYDVRFEVKDKPTLFYTVNAVSYGTNVNSLADQVKAVLGTTFEDEHFTYTYAGLENVAATDIVEADATYYVLYTATPKTPTGVHNTQGQGEWKKVFRNGQIYILRDGKTYLLTGEEVNAND